ncbi:Gfo/Idh/MocA family protein [Spirosoma sp. KUDC1026]|uniref:Gfo/Idh/MocA family protein n=1 Tax=Spirosoma sp. KUDC1026 TaxID=2745947 RepID=UPI001E35C2F4|nr:Gfo/Idh/MocA family oxidoreductase [Spirosoma sp. KUDC1026]
MNEPTDFRYRLAKVWRYAGLYGWSRTINKVIGRMRWMRLPRFGQKKDAADTSFIGCGQFAFTSLAFFLRKRQGAIFLDAYDTDPQQAETLAKFYRFRSVAPTLATLLANPSLKRVYIASNHASHTPYAVALLARGVDVYLEKPIAVTRAQLAELRAAQRQSSARLYAGYNRPYASGIQLLRPYVTGGPTTGAFSLSCVVNGHRIPFDHWYRRPEEGSRICGNLGHWIDLMMHVLAWRGLPDWFDIGIVRANPAEPDDNLTITFTTDRHDLISLMLTARSEPFEGVSEQINLQYNDLIAHIDDFRRMTLWQGKHRERWRFSPKDVGHERATLQPFRADNRDWWEVELSTLLTLHISEQVNSGSLTSRFKIAEELARLEADTVTIVRTLPTHEHPDRRRYPAELYESSPVASGIDESLPDYPEASAYGAAL